MIRKVLKFISLLFLGLIIILVFFIFNPSWQADDSEVIVEIKAGSGLWQAANKIKERGVVKSSFPLLSYAIITGNSDNIQAGKYRFDKDISVVKIIDKIAKGEVLEKKITIVEGWSLVDIADHLEKLGICTKKELFSITGLPEPKAKLLGLEKITYKLNGYDILENLPANSSLEGYLFPDTYKIKNDDPKVLITQMISNLEVKVSPHVHEIEEAGKTLHEVIIMASLLEKEVTGFDDKRRVSDILWRRLKAGIPLQVDATVNYITGRRDINVFNIEFNTDSLYNTYQHLGLPKGPISNPGIESIEAAINPKNNDYWYYLSNPKTKETIFNRTHREHIEDKNKYLKNN